MGTHVCVYIALCNKTTRLWSGSRGFHSPPGRLYAPVPSVMGEGSLVSAELKDGLGNWLRQIHVSSLAMILSEVTSENLLDDVNAAPRLTSLSNK